MIDRYDVPEVSAIWSDEARMRNWLEIELAVVEAWAVVGVVPKDDARACRDRASLDVDAVLERERVTRHDVAAFVDVVAASIG
ncbi:MAG TPA: adenylosuccinate lyase, partial [Actinomycetota bacterium]|nr:adenylosuccinate lyase [Actinomycetota bacterium]